MTALLTDAAGSPDPLSGLSLIVLSDGRAGHENQSRGVALALGISAPQVVCLPALRHGLAQWLPVPWAYGRQPTF